MFKGLKDKLKNALGKFSKKVHEEGEEEKTEVEVTKEKTPEKEKKEVVVKQEVKTPEEEVFEEIREEVEKEEREEEEPEEKKELPISREEALELLKKYNREESDFNHYFESEAIMKALANKLGEDEEYWGMLGLLHDVDWGVTKENVKDHLTKMPEILKEAGFDQEFIDIILSHGYGYDIADLEDKKRTKKIEYALAASETITGLIHAYALMRGRTMEGMEVKGLKNKFKDKAFAANVNREIIKEVENLGLSLDEFFKIAIDAIKSISNKVGLGKVEDREKPKLKEENVEEKFIEKKEGFFKKLKKSITTKKINDKQFEEFFYDLELALLENNVAVEVIEKIKDSLKMDLVNVPIEKKEIDNIVKKSLKKSLEEIFDVEKVDLFKRIEEKDGVFLVVFVGVNGSGKTTTIAKIANMLKGNGISCVLAAADTFRAAAIHQLEEHGEKLGLKVIKHDYGSDPAAVIFDAVKHAKAKKIKVVLADTAGRQQSNVNLVEEMKKIVRVNNPDLKIFVGESITGNDCVEQARSFNEAIGVDGIILSKADIDDKGGAAVSVSFVTGKPILYVGTGQEYKDLEEFDKEKIIKSLF